MEIEAKLGLRSTVTPEEIEALDWTPYQLGARHVVDQHDVFFDTADLALSRTRHAVRVRDLGTHLVVTLKGPGSVIDGVHSREEWEEPTTDRDPMAWPATIREHVRNLIGTAAIAPLIEVRNLRHMWVLQRDGATIGEVALDRGTISAGTRSEPMHELEIELKGGATDDLRPLVTMIAAALPAQPEDRSKFARGLALARPDLRTAIEGNT